MTEVPRGDSRDSDEAGIRRLALRCGYADAESFMAAYREKADKEKLANAKGKVSLVLGAGNVASIGPMDALYKLFVETAERNVERRLRTNQFYFSIVAALFVAYSWMAQGRFSLAASSAGRADTETGAARKPANRKRTTAKRQA